MKRLTVLAAPGLLVALVAGSFIQAADSTPKVIDSKLSVGTSATRTPATATDTLTIADPTGSLAIRQIRPDTDITVPFQTFEHRTTAAGAAVTKYEWRINSSGDLILHDDIADTARLTLGFTSGAFTFGVAPIQSALTASRLVVTDSSKALASNGALVTNTVPKSASSGATLADSSITDDGTTAVIGSALLSKRQIEVSIVAKTTTAAESGEVYTNQGDGDGSTITLLNDPTIGTYYTIIATASQTITITASSGETLTLGNDTCAVSITMGTLGAQITVTAASGGSGAVWSAVGTGATCNDA